VALHAADDPESDGGSSGGAALQYDSTRTSLPDESSPNSFIEFGQIDRGTLPTYSSLGLWFHRSSSL
jgi:hypothetical protein